MKNLLTLGLILCSSLSQAQQTDGIVDIASPSLPLQIAVAGSGSYVCSSEDGFQHVPILGRGQSRREAEVVAMQECGKTTKNGTFFCKITNCEQDLANGKNVAVVFDITRSASQVNIGFSGKTKFACYAKGWNTSYVAKAPTQTEALAIAKRLCSEDEGVRRNSEPNGFFCSAEARDCEMQQGIKGTVGIDDVIGIFKKRK